MTIINKSILMGSTLSLLLFFSGCDEDSSSTDDENQVYELSDYSEEIDDDKDDDDNNNIITIPVLTSTYKSNVGRLLGSQCAQCHGTNGISVNRWDSIAGEDELESEIFEDDEPIMSAQAHGYTSEEIRLIGNWLKTLNKNDD